MAEWWTVIFVFWGAYLADGLRRGRRPTTLITRAAPLPASCRHECVHGLPPLPWAWRFRSDDPPFSISPVGICNQPAASAGRPADPAPFTAVWRWEQIRTVTEKDGWLVINGLIFGPAAGAWRAAYIQELATTLPGLAADARSAELRRRLDACLRPAHWRRRLDVVRRRTRAVAFWNTGALLAAAAVTAIACSAPADAENTPRIYSLLMPLSAAWLAAYIGGVAAALLAVRRLRRWLLPGVAKAIVTAAFFPPQGMRWRRLITEACPPVPHPLIAALAVPGNRMQMECAFQTLSDSHWPLPLPERQSEPGRQPQPGYLNEADSIRSWHSDEMRLRAEGWLRRAGIDPVELLRAPAADHPASRSYCPRCRSQFARAAGTCPRGVALRPLGSGADKSVS